ncbi:hypothetical protein QJQ45_000289 [Haematococcus lacustris]|nr:hypothetical protein QJQ45_000289 [Haematococcus lacustris]
MLYILSMLYILCVFGTYPLILESLPCDNLVWEVVAVPVAKGGFGAALLRVCLALGFVFGASALSDVEATTPQVATAAAAAFCCACICYFCCTTTCRHRPWRRRISSGGTAVGCTPPAAPPWAAPLHGICLPQQSLHVGLLSSAATGRPRARAFYDRDVSAALNIRRCAVGPGSGDPN